MIDLAKFHRACDAVIKAAKEAPGNISLQYASSYAIAGKKMNDTNSVQTQALYIKGDCNYWRGNVAQETKKALQEIIDAK